MITLKNVSKTFGKYKVLQSLSFQIEPGEFICVTGPSGAGKSTLIHLLTGAEPLTSGSIEIDGAKLHKLPPPVMQLYRQRVGIVFQDYKLLPHQTVAENIAFPLEVCGVPDNKITKRLNEVLKEMELTKHKNTLPHALSGGEKARVAIGRAIVHEPMILLADEPTGNIDPDQSMEIIKLFQKIHKGGTTVVLATHDASLVNKLKTRVIHLDEGEVVRDSVGGYKSSKKQKGGEQPHHKIFSGMDIVQTDKAPKKKDSGEGKKVRITSINS